MIWSASKPSQWPIKKSLLNTWLTESTAQKTLTISKLNCKILIIKYGKMLNTEMDKKFMTKMAMVLRITKSSPLTNWTNSTNLTTSSLSSMFITQDMETCQVISRDTSTLLKLSQKTLIQSFRNQSTTQTQLFISLVSLVDSDGAENKLSNKSNSIFKS